MLKARGGGYNLGSGVDGNCGDSVTLRVLVLMQKLVMALALSSAVIVVALAAALSCCKHSFTLTFFIMVPRRSSLLGWGMYFTYCVVFEGQLWPAASPGARLEHTSDGGPCWWL
jgi:hypothetical protein